MKKLWIAFAAVLISSFAVLLWVGTRIYQEAPPVPERVVTTDGRLVVRPGQIARGQQVWQALGGMEVGSIWGHGAYVAPDWSADWLHRELLSVLDQWARASGRGSYVALEPEAQAALRARLETTHRPNTYDAETGTLTIAPERAVAFEENARHYATVFREGRDDYAMPRGTLTDANALRDLSAFFFWTSWAAVTHRPGEEVTYTSNWPHEPLIGNTPTADALVWTGVSIILLLAGIGAMISWYAVRRPEEEPPEVPHVDPLLGSTPTPSQRASIKYFWVVAALIVVQILLGVITAHYGVEGSGFYGIPLAEVLPYSVARTWHVQLGIFWIATAWLGAGLAIAPSVGHEPKYQKLGVDVLFYALLVIVVGSMVGQWLSIRHMLSGDAWWLFGHSGYEYIDLGRAFQVGLLVGLFLWVILVARAIWPALARRDAQRPILLLFLISTVAIGGFYVAALGAGRSTNLAVAEYWRWWVVHLWVEGFFEVFATVVIAFLFARLGLLNLRSSARAVVLSATIFLAGGIIGTLHHLYFSGTPTVVLALGSVFSALEVVPLVFVGYEAWENYRHTRRSDWMQTYRWPIYFFVAVAFWNLVGAGLFGFMINPPIALYYMQGLNTTPVHGHAALFGVYGMLGMGLVLFTLRAVRPQVRFPNRLLAFAFWAINGGLMAMILLSLLPLGLLQTWASVRTGYWYARSPELLQLPVFDTLRWLRVPGDTIFALGALAFVVAVAQVTLGRARKTEARRAPRAPAVPTPEPLAPG
ncbi:nitric-oxide reductase large subunit [Myxococcota bacterium]|nr:nitric-oxide reductase large subunit [Myxococcota bacterium]